ncbi:VanZ family protein [Diaminobutyricibacter sp. McL0618]|uniref:VanZ family protein n=1 Tax=Leifsonia sp. McL0618 TaxID=3415677 RepID=UPI003CF2C5DC
MELQSKPDTVRDEPLTWRTMTLLVKIGTVVIWVAFVLYLVFLLKLLLFSRALGSERSLNLIPFATISNYLFSDSAGVKRVAIGNILGNVVAFVPLGAFLPLLRRRIGMWSNLLIVVCASVSVELVQGIFGVGASDIDDVILNTLGGLVGILFFTLLRVLLRRWSRLIIVMAVLSLLAVPILSYLLFAIRLRM